MRFREGTFAFFESRLEDAKVQNPTACSANAALLVRALGNRDVKEHVSLTPWGVNYCRVSPSVASAIFGDTKRNFHCRPHLAMRIRRQAKPPAAAEVHGLFLSSLVLVRRAFCRLAPGAAFAILGDIIRKLFGRRRFMLRARRHIAPSGVDRSTALLSSLGAGRVGQR